MNLTVETTFEDDSLRDFLWYCCFWSILTQVFMAIWNQEVWKILKGKLFIVRIDWFECCRNNVYVFHLTAKLIFYQNRLEMPKMRSCRFQSQTTSNFRNVVLKSKNHNSKCKTLALTLGFKTNMFLFYQGGYWKVLNLRL